MKRTEQRRIVREMLATLRAEMQTAVERAPEGWDGRQLRLLLVRKAETFSPVRGYYTGREAAADRRADRRMVRAFESDCLSLNI